MKLNPVSALEWLARVMAVVMVAVVLLDVAHFLMFGRPLFGGF